MSCSLRHDFSQAKEEEAKASKVQSKRKTHSAPQMESRAGANSSRPETQTQISATCTELKSDEGGDYQTTVHSRQDDSPGKEAVEGTQVAL